MLEGPEKWDEAARLGGRERRQPVKHPCPWRSRYSYYLLVPHKEWAWSIDDNPRDESTGTWAQENLSSGARNASLYAATNKPPLQ
jgi:hypothetical protein